MDLGILIPDETLVILASAIMAIAREPRQAIAPGNIRHFSKK
jgi:hypothetical protein